MTPIAFLVSVILTNPHLHGVARAEVNCGGPNGIFASLLAPARNRKGFMKLSSGREMYYEYLAGEPGKPVAVMDHGLGDNLRDLDALARYHRKDGFGILRVDHHGHGKTLERFREGNSAIPPVIDYMDNVADEVELINKLGIRRVALEGHSYGGALVLPMANTLQKNGVKVESITQMANYPFRLDEDIQDMFRDGTIVYELQNKAIEKSGAPEELVDFLKQQNEHWREALRSQMKPAKDVRKLLASWTGIARGMDRAMEPMLDDFMKKAYRKYFLHKFGKEERDLTRAQSTLLDDRVAAAIAATKGIRSFNVFDPALEYPAGVPIHVLIGEKDALVPKRILMEYVDMLKERGHPVRVDVLPQGNHLFPQLQAKETYKLIKKAFDEISEQQRQALPPWPWPKGESAPHTAPKSEVNGEPNSPLKAEPHSEVESAPESSVHP